MNNTLDWKYNVVLKNLLHGERFENRTGVAALKGFPTMIQHDMHEGFPLLTTKRVATKTMMVELEGFIKGVTSKKWFQERGCRIWDEWCNPQAVPYSTDAEIQQKMSECDDLGPCIYGGSWRNFHDPSLQFGAGMRVDQLKNLTETLLKNPTDRRMICMAWNPLGLAHSALPPCHMMFQVTTRGRDLDLTWYQRSCDWFLGVPFNIASYGMLLHLLAHYYGFNEGLLTGFFCDVHLYENHVEQAKEQLSRYDLGLPHVETEKGEGLFSWDHTQTKIVGYSPHPAIRATVAV